jgi:hypothetical protein
LTSDLFCFKVIEIFFGLPENDEFHEEKKFSSEQPVRAVVPLSSIGGNKPITRRF